MSAVSRRNVLAGAAGAATAVGVTAASGTISPPRALAANPEAPLSSVTVSQGDARYSELTTGMNQRWVSNPEYIQMVSTTSQVVTAVQGAVDKGKRISVQGGGHCYADFVHNPDVQAIINMSEMKAVYFDKERNAFAVEAGATLLEVYETLFKYWGVTIPGGMCFSVGTGGHVSGGGYGLLSRKHGLTVDHLYAIEVVTVDAAGKAQAVVATREKNDPNRELWWAHTGGGGGNFGVITRYWFRSPGVTSTSPTEILPKPPKTVLVNRVLVPWNELDEAGFKRMVKNYGAWHEKNSAPGAAGSSLTSFFLINHKSNGTSRFLTVVDGSDPNADKVLKDFLSAVAAGTNLKTPLYSVERMPWFTAARLLGTDNPTLTSPVLRGDYKSAYMKKNLTDAQAAAMYKHLTRSNYNNAESYVVLLSYGGQINGVPSDSTAAAQRDSAFKVLVESFWSDPAEDTKNVGWCRDVFQEMYSNTGGYPVPNDATDGCYINYPDTDITDPNQNKSGVPWSTLYYKNNYPRLQNAKSKYDPKNIFRHSQSIAPAK